MDPKALREVIGQKIDKYAATLPSRLKEDFVQDMWVFALDGLFKTFEAATARTCDIKGDIDLAIFRKQARWVSVHKRRAGCEQPEEASPEPSGPGTGVMSVEAKEAVHGLVKNLERFKYSPEDIQTVVLGFQDDLTQKEIAERIGRSPALLWTHLHTFRTAA